MVVEQIVTPRNFIVNLGFASVDNEFLGLTICSTTLSVMCYLYIITLFFLICLLLLTFIKWNIKNCLSLPQTKMTSVILIATPLLIREAMIFIKCSSASRPIYIKAMMKVNGRKQFFYEQHKTG